MYKYLWGFIGYICKYSEPTQMARPSRTLIYVIEGCRQIYRSAINTNKQLLLQILKSQYILLVSHRILHICLGQVRNASRCRRTTSAFHNTSCRSYAVNDNSPAYAKENIFKACSGLLRMCSCSALECSPSLQGTATVTQVTKHGK